MWIYSNTYTLQTTITLLLKHLKLTVLALILVIIGSFPYNNTITLGITNISLLFHVENFE